jgi:hypothetical protein
MDGKNICSSRSIFPDQISSFLELALRRVSREIKCLHQVCISYITFRKMYRARTVSLVFADFAHYTHFGHALFLPYFCFAARCAHILIYKKTGFEQLPKSAELTSSATIHHPCVMRIMGRQNAHKYVFCPAVYVFSDWNCCCLSMRIFSRKLVNNLISLLCP